MTFTGLHGVMSQKIELFIATAVSTSNLTGLKRFTNRIVIIWKNDFSGFDSNSELNFYEFKLGTLHEKHAVAT
jgi:hypothetical protein